MSFKERTEIVGKQFVSVESEVCLAELDKSHWEWKTGIVRAVSDRDLTDNEAQVHCRLTLLNIILF